MDRIAVRNSKLNIFLWNFIKTLTICSMLLMVLSIYYSFFGLGDGIGNRGGGVLTAIIVAFAMISYTFINPNLAQIAAAAIPFIGLNDYLIIRLLKLAVCLIGGVKYPFLVYFLSSSLMTSVGLLKLYGDGGPACKRVMDVIVGDAIQPGMYMFGYHEEIHGARWVECGTGWDLFGLFIMGLIAHHLPPLMEPVKKKMNATATISIPCEKKMNMAEAAISSLA